MTEKVETITTSFIIPPGCVERFLPVHRPYSRPLVQRGFSHAGISDLKAPYEMGRPNFHEHVVIFILGGRGILQTPGSECNMLPGEAWLLPARNPYRYQAAPEGWKIGWVHIKEDNPASYAMPAQVTRRTDIDFTVCIAMAEEYIRETLRQDLDATAAGALAELVAIHFDRLLRPAMDARRTAERKRLDMLWQEVDNQLARPWTVPELAQQFSLSPAQFRRIVQEHDQLTPLQKLTALRLARARELLSGTDYPLARIAALVGYDSPYSFSRTFHRAIGASPGAFRRRD